MTKTYVKNTWQIKYTENFANLKWSYENSEQKRKVSSEMLLHTSNCLQLG